MAASITIRIFPLYGIDSPYLGYRYGIRTLVEITTSGNDAITSKSLTVTYGGSNISGTHTRTITVPANSTKKLVYNEFKESRQDIYSDFGGYVTVSASTKLNSGTSVSGSSTVTWPTTVSNITNYGCAFPTVDSTLQNPSWTLDTQGTIVIHAGRGISDYTYELTLSAGSHTATIFEDKAATSGGNWSYTPTVAEFGPYFSSTETKILATLKLTIYASDGTKINNPFVTGTNVVPEYMDYNDGYLVLPASVCPTITSVTPSDTEGFRNTYGVYIGTKSILQASIEASGIYGSTITKVEHQIDDLSVSTTDPTITKLIGKLNQSGSRTLKTTVTDSRGRTGVKNTAITVVPYVPPSVSLTADRWDTINNEVDDGSDIVRLVVEGTIPSINGIAVTGSLVLGYREADGNVYTTIGDYDVTGPNISKQVLVPSQLLDKRYLYYAALRDSYPFLTSVEAEDTVGTSRPILEFHSSGNGVGIGVVAPEVGLDIGMQTNFRGTEEDGYSRIQITDPEGNDSVILANLAGSELQLLINALGGYDRAKIFSHIFLDNNKALGAMTTSGGQTSILKMNTSDQVELTWTSGGLKGRVFKQIWTGTWTSGSITVSEAPYYNVFGFNFGNPSGQSWTGLGFRCDSNIHAFTFSWNNSAAPMASVAAKIGISGTKLSLAGKSHVGLWSNAWTMSSTQSNSGITRIWGIL